MRTITRNQAIRELRPELRRLVESDASLCSAVARRDVFCRGFAQWSLRELRARFPRIAAQHPDADREAFVALADRWVASRCAAEQGRLPCDVAALHRDESPCAGWDDLYEAELGSSVGELCGEAVRVVPDGLRGILPRDRA